MGFKRAFKEIFSSSPSTDDSSSNVIEDYRCKIPLEIESPELGAISKQKGDNGEAAAALFDNFNRIGKDALRNIGIIPSTPNERIIKCEDRIKKLKEEYTFHMRRAQEIFEELIGKSEIDKEKLPSPAYTPPQIPPNTPFIRHIPKALSRKPRDLKFSPSKNEFITTSLDGRIFLWSKSHNNSLPQVKSSFYLPSFLGSPGRPEHLFWRDDLTAYLVTEGPNSEIISLNLDQQNFNRELKTHTNISAGYFSEASNKFYLGNTEKAIEVWDFSKSKPNIIHRNHTSTVQSINMLGSNLISGGADCRLVLYDLKNQEINIDERFDYRISHILTPSNMDQHCFLVSFCTSEPKQLGWFDMREGGFVMRFGWNEESNLSRYLSPSLHSNGFNISCGTCTPISCKTNSINIFDIRKKDPLTLTIDSSFGKERRRFLRTEFSSSTSLNITAMSTDGMISFIDFS